MIKFYDYPLRLRQTPFQEAYRVHQQLDTLLQEGNNYRFPYCWHHEKSQINNASEVVFRTITKLPIPGEKCTEIDVVEGMDLSFSVRLFNAVNQTAGGSREATFEDIQKRLPNSLKLSGFELLCVTPIEKGKYFVIKPGQSSFPIPYLDVVLTVTVLDVALAEKALAQGIGRRKAFGCGMLRDIEVI